MIKGTDRITTQFKTNTLNLYLVWHRRENDDAAHQWFRQKIIETVKSIVGK
jgi:DNA-binding transcriptional LysR family regulator